MKISKVEYNNRRRALTVYAEDAVYSFPYSKATPAPAAGNYVKMAFVDDELGSEGFSYVLESGQEGAVHMDAVLEVNNDPEHMKDLLIYNLTLVLRKAVKRSPISTRELIRQMNTSPSQFYRMLDPTNTTKSINQMVKLLYMLGNDLEFVIRLRDSGSWEQNPVAGHTLTRA